MKIVWQVEKIADLREVTTFQIYHALRKTCDPEVAALASWYVLHNKPLKNLSKFYNSNNKNKILIDKKIIDFILDNYKQNKLTGKTYSLLPCSSKK